jgi:hypothetical protein
MPLFVRSRISARSSWAAAPRTCKVNRPCGLAVSIAQTAEEGAARLQALDHDQQMGQRARQPIERDHDQRVACPDAREGLGQDRAVAIAARGVFLEHLGAACRPELIELAVGDLVASLFIIFAKDIETQRVNQTGHRSDDAREEAVHFRAQAKLRDRAPVPHNGNILRTVAQSHSVNATDGEGRHRAAPIPRPRAPPGRR